MSYNFLQSTTYSETRELWERQYRRQIRETEYKILKNPKTAGTKLTGKTFKTYRHAEIKGTREGLRLFYVICGEVIASYRNKWRMIQTGHLSNIYRLCNYFCAHPCEITTENTVMLLTIITHKEQERIFGT